MLIDKKFITIPFSDIERLFWADAAQFAAATALLDDFLLAAASAPTAIIAGGCIRDLISGKPPTNDIDIFVNTGEIDTVCKAVCDKLGYAIKYETATIATLTKNDAPDVQIIARFAVDDCASVLAQFDLSVSQFALMRNGVVTTPLALHDLGAKRLRIVHVTFPIATAKRIKKYEAKGFIACDGTWKSLFDAVRMLSDDEYASNLKITYVD